MDLCYYGVCLYYIVMNIDSENLSDLLKITKMVGTRLKLDPQVSLISEFGFNSYIIFYIVYCSVLQALGSFVSITSLRTRC